MDPRAAEVWPHAPVVLAALDAVAGKPLEEAKGQLLQVLGIGSDDTIVDVSEPKPGIEDFEHALHAAVFARLESEDEAKVSEAVGLLDAVAALVVELFERTARPGAPQAETERCKNWWTLLLVVAEDTSRLIPSRHLGRLVTDWERSLPRLRTAYLGLAEQRLKEFDAKQEADARPAEEGEIKEAPPRDPKAEAAKETKRIEDRRKLINFLGISPNGQLYLTLTSLLKQLSSRLCSSLHAPLRARIVLLLEHILAMDHKAIANNQKLRTQEWITPDDLDGRPEAGFPEPPAPAPAAARPAAAEAGGEATAPTDGQAAAPADGQASTPATEAAPAAEPPIDAGAAAASGAEASVAPADDAAVTTAAVGDASPATATAKDAAGDATGDAAGKAAAANKDTQVPAAEAAAAAAAATAAAAAAPAAAAAAAPAAAAAAAAAAEAVPEMVTIEESAPAAASNLGNDPAVNFELYQSFWGLQEALQFPEKMFEKPDSWKAFQRTLSKLLALFLKHPVQDHAHQPWTPPEPAPLRHAPRGRALPVQLDDPGFREQFLIQVMIAFQALEVDVSSKRAHVDGLISRQKEDIRKEFQSLKRLCEEALQQTRDGFPKLLRHLLERESHWVTWKGFGCREFKHESLEMLNAKIAPVDGLPEKPVAPKVAKPQLQPHVRGMLGTLKDPKWSLPKEQKVAEGQEESTDDIRQNALWKMCDDYLERLLEEDDPKNAVEEEYKAKRNKVFMWQCRRLFAQKHLRTYSQKENNSKTEFMDYVRVVKGKTLALPAVEGADPAAVEVLPSGLPTEPPAIMDGTAESVVPKTADAKTACDAAQATSEPAAAPAEAAPAQPPEVIVADTTLVDPTAAAPADPVPAPDAAAQSAPPAEPEAEQAASAQKREAVEVVDGEPEAKKAKK